MTDRVDDRQSIVPADREVLLAVRRRGVHRARAGLERHMVAQITGTCLASHGCSSCSPSSAAPRQRPMHLPLQSVAGRQAADQFIGEHQALPHRADLGRGRRRIRNPRRTATASLAGSVQGVVVQITTDTGSDPSAGTPPESAHEIGDI